MRGTADLRAGDDTPQPRPVRARRVARRTLALVAALVLLPTAGPTTADAAALTVRFVSLPPTRPGADVTATVATKAGAACTIVVRYKSGPSKAKGLTKKTASGAGRVSWTWRVGTNTTPGSWPVTVTCRKGSATGSATRNLVVRRGG